MSKFVYNITDAVEALQEQIEVLQGQADAVVAAPREVKKYDEGKGISFRLFRVHRFGCDYDLQVKCYFEDTSGTFYHRPEVTQEYLDRVLVSFDAGVAAWKEKNEAVRLENEETIAFNKEQIEKLKKIMGVLGIRDQYTTWEYKTTRSRNRTETKHEAGYLGDIKRVIDTECNYQTFLDRFEKKRKAIVSYGENKIEEARKEKLAIEMKKAADKTAKTTMKMQIKYCEDNDEASNWEILEAIITKDKYLYLAHYLEMNRGDWSDDCHYAETGLGGFTVETDTDKLIEDEIQNHIDNWDGDGRVFRDCEYNYDVLFGMVEDKKLLADYETFKEIVG